MNKVDLPKNALTLALWTYCFFCAANLICAQEHVDNTLSVVEHRLTNEFRAFRSRRGTIQKDWIRALQRPVTKQPERSSAQPDSQAYRMQVAKLFGVGNDRLLDSWIKENDELIRELIALPPPAGPLPLPDDYRIGERDLLGIPSVQEMREKSRLLAVCAALAKTAEARNACFQTLDNISRLATLGGTDSELGAAIAIIHLEWQVLLLGLYYDSKSFEPVILARPESVTREDLAVAIRECIRRSLLYAVSDPQKSGLGPERWTLEQTRELDGILLDFSSRTESLQSLDELMECEKKIADQKLRDVVDWLLKLSQPKATHFLYVDDLSKVTRAIAKSGVQGIGQVQTHYFQLIQVKDQWLAKRGDRTYQLWPPLDQNRSGFQALNTP